MSALIVSIISIISPVMVAMFIYLHRLGGRLALVEYHVKEVSDDLDRFVIPRKPD